MSASPTRVMEEVPLSHPLPSPIDEGFSMEQRLLTSGSVCVSAKQVPEGALLQVSQGDLKQKTDTVFAEDTACCHCNVSEQGRGEGRLAGCQVRSQCHPR